MLATFLINSHAHNTVSASTYCLAVSAYKVDKPTIIHMPHYYYTNLISYHTS